MTTPRKPGARFRPTDLRRWIKTLDYASDEVVRGSASSSEPDTFDEDLADLREFLGNVVRTLEKRPRR